MKKAFVFHRAIAVVSVIKVLLFLLLVMVDMWDWSVAAAWRMSTLIHPFMHLGLQACFSIFLQCCFPTKTQVGLDPATFLQPHPQPGYRRVHIYQLFCGHILSKSLNLFDELKGLTSLCYLHHRKRFISVYWYLYPDNKFYSGKGETFNTTQTSGPFTYIADDNVLVTQVRGRTLHVSRVKRAGRRF